MSNTHNKYNIYMLHCKVRNAMETRKSKGRGAGSGGGQGSLWYLVGCQAGMYACVEQCEEGERC